MWTTDGRSELGGRVLSGLRKNQRTYHTGQSGNLKSWLGADETSTGGRGARPPNGWRAEEGVIPNGLSSLSEEYSDPYLPTGESGRTRREVSHLTHNGYGYRNEIWKKKHTHTRTHTHTLTHTHTHTHTHTCTHTNTSAYSAETHIASIYKHTQQAGIVIDTWKLMVRTDTKG